MTRAPDMQLSMDLWPADDRKRWQSANQAGSDIFEDGGSAAHLAGPTRRALQGSYARFLGFLSAKYPRLLDDLPDMRVDRDIIAQYVAFRRPTCGNSGIAIDLHHLRLALTHICPDINWAWLLTIAKRIAAQAIRKPEKHHLVTSESLYVFGIELMDQAVASVTTDAGVVTKAAAFDFRDGLLIALVALVPMRRRTVTAPRVGQQLIKVGTRWELSLPAKDIKTKRALEYPISAALSERIDLYLCRFRPRIPGANRHDGLWPSNKGRPMDDGTIYDMVCRRTKAAFGFAINLHRFRSAAATFWSIHDPANVRAVKDLLGQASFDTTEKYYIMAQCRIAGRSLAKAIDHATKARD